VIDSDGVDDAYISIDHHWSFLWFPVDKGMYNYSMSESAEDIRSQGIELLEQGLLKEALAEFDRALQIDPTDADIWYNKGDTAYELGRFEDALMAFDRALQINPHDTEIWCSKGNAAYELGRFEDALVAFGQALQINPGEAVSWYGKGKALSKVERHEEALAAFNRALQIQPDFAFAWYHKGNALAALACHSDALAAFERAIQIDPTDADAWHEKGRALFNLRRNQEALAAYDEWAKLIRDDRDCAWHGQHGSPTPGRPDHLSDAEKELSCPDGPPPCKGESCLFDPSAAPAIDKGSPLSIERTRLLSLIEFSQQSARLRGKPAAAVATHGHFALYEHEIQGLPGIRVNVNGPESEDEIWIAVERLHEVRPPEIASPILRPWVQMTQAPTEEPRLRQAVDGGSLIAAGTHCSSKKPQQQDKLAIDPETTITLSDYDEAALVRTNFAAYLTTKWHPWAEEEKLRRRTIRLYSQLFTLNQQIEGNIVDAAIELVWGVGLGIWNCNGVIASYPLVGRLVEMALNTETAEVEIRPRDVDAHIEVDWYASVDNPGVVGLDKAAKEFFGEATTTFSPFDRGTFEPLLRTAVTNLDVNGIYWPSEVPAEDRTLPMADDKLKVTDTWVLFARPRTNSLFLQDLEKLKKQAAEAESYPPAVAAVVTEPNTTNPVIELPLFRGVSASSHSERSRSGKTARDLYFPKAFNDEQVRIVQLLDISDGVVVQGPPGTGKTHTIANVICHYLAEGKRVLVTSMKDQALLEVQDKLPVEIRSLAISLLTSEQEGMRQFEHAIQKIASEVQGLDRSGTAKDINHLEESIDVLHGKLASTDRKISEWARGNLAKVKLETEEVDPQDAAREVVGNAGQFEWIPDPLGIGRDFAPQFSDSDVVRLREARRTLGKDIDYLDASLPQLVEFPDSKALFEVHRDLSQFEKLKQGVERGEVPALADSSQETLDVAQELLLHIAALQRLRGEVMQVHHPSTATMCELLRHGSNDNLLPLLEALGAELEQALERRLAFFEQPVTTPAGIEFDVGLAEAVMNLADGKSPFGLKGLFGKSAQKKNLDSIRVLGNPPTDAQGWKHVAAHLALLRSLRQLAFRWNALAHELQLELVPEDKPEGGVAAAQCYALYLKVKRMVKAESELCSEASRVFPDWAHAREVEDNTQRLAELEKALRHHLTKNRLANVWAAKERFQKVLEGRTGRVIEDIRRFLSKILGNPEIEDARMQAEWSALMAELSRVLGVGTHLAAVRDVCGTVEASGAPRYAAALKQPLVGTVDGLLPDNWRQAWRLRRLATYLETIDAQEELKKLAKCREEVESDLSRAYRDIVVKRTWLKLAENASPSIRAALMAYLTAIKNIGKTGKGKKAKFAQVEARRAAEQANPAVPCWIMPHYRVSESLPAQFGCFDLVVIDEASQSDLTALPSLLRAKKVLIVGDDKQVSPVGVGLEVDKMHALMDHFLGNQVEIYRPQMWPDRSIYDLFRVVFAKSAVMLKEHFRCVGPIIEYSKREFYNHELQPLRVPKASERLDPPLIDVLVEDGYRNGDVNRPEARFIVDEIKAIVADPNMGSRSIGVVSLLADKQALEIWELLTSELGPELMQRHRIACGDARTFQGKERDIMFLSMVAVPSDKKAISGSMYEQRFNVAASRARDRMYLVRSVELGDLSEKDKLRRSLIGHFAAPFAQDEVHVEDLRKFCESDFEREMYDELSKRGYRVTPQVKVGSYRIDMVVEGHNDARLAVECDGDKYHGADKWDADMQRERNLGRAGWGVFWRCFASAFIRRRKEVLDDLLKTLAERGIEPIGAEGAQRSVHTERRVVSIADESANGGNSMPVEMLENAQSLPSAVQPTQSSAASRSIASVRTRLHPPADDQDLFDCGRVPISLIGPRNDDLQFCDYSVHSGPRPDDPRGGNTVMISEGIVRIVEVEGPVVAKRVYDIYLRGCGIRRMGHELRRIMNEALEHAIREGRLVSEDEANEDSLVFSVVRVNGIPPIKLRTRGPRSFEEIPPSELQVVARYLAERYGFASGSDEHLRAVLERFDLKRLTTQVGTALLEILERRIPYVDEFISRIPK
jgi:tetratricopeptide (TPR) repeat protein/very-short-patch-repair endonuclease/phosphopantetheinyl transferase (holo-ACP synthase)/Cdc6-like AAA superfamily ATPase